MATATQQQMSFVDMTIESCRDCRDICVETVFHAMQLGGEFSQMDVLGVLMDCAGIAELSERYMLRGSPYFRRIAPSTIEVCESAARMCDTVQGDAFFRTCARSCRRCADNLSQIG
jgi:hypothetical protein